MQDRHSKFGPHGRSRMEAVKTATNITLKIHHSTSMAQSGFLHREVVRQSSKEPEALETYTRKLQPEINKVRWVLGVSMRRLGTDSDTEDQRSYATITVYILKDPCIQRTSKNPRQLPYSRAPELIK